MQEDLSVYCGRHKNGNYFFLNPMNTNHLVLFRNAETFHSYFNACGKQITLLTYIIFSQWFTKTKILMLLLIESELSTNQDDNNKMTTKIPQYKVKK